MELEIITNLNNLPETVEFNFENLRRQIITHLTKYNNFEVTENNMKESTALRAKLNKFRESIEDRRKEIKNRCLQPYNDFEDKIKMLLKLIDGPLDNLKNQINNFETIRQDRKRAEIREMFIEIAPENNTIDLEHPFFWNERWLNRTFDSLKIKEEMKEKFTEISNGLNHIEELIEPEYQLIAKNTFLEHFKLTEAIYRVKSLRTPKEQQRPVTGREETERQNMIVKTESQKPAAETKLYSVSFGIRDTKENIYRVRDFMRTNGINYTKINS
ncbi:MAG: DUF1351 domain-containing protein [Rickettsiales bacterium]|jgi:hypothetical protein|nr:DUF1351 domain-containing protein [Rickettsiales bacterium]